MLKKCVLGILFFFLGSYMNFLFTTIINSKYQVYSFSIYGILIFFLSIYILIKILSFMDFICVGYKRYSYFAGLLLSNFLLLGFLFPRILLAYFSYDIYGVSELIYLILLSLFIGKYISHRKYE